MIVESLATLWPPVFFLTGATLATVTFALLTLGWLHRMHDPEGLWIVLYLTTWPGAIILGIVAAKFARKRPLSRLHVLLLGWIAPLAGFLLDAALVGYFMYS